MTRNQLAASLLAAATLVTVATSPPDYGSWESDHVLDAQQFTMEAPDQARDVRLTVTTSGGLDEAYWGGLRLEVSIDSVQLQIPDQAQPDTGDTAEPIETLPLALAITLVEDGEEISREAHELFPEGPGDQAIALVHYAGAKNCEDLGECALPITLRYELDRPLQDGEVLVFDWSARGVIGGQFAEEGQADPDIAIELSLLD
jgi:hypothetical protein